MNQILAMSVEQLSKNLKEGLISAKDVCRMCLKRAKYTRKLNAFITLTDAEAQKQAEVCDKRIKSGKTLGTLDGIPIAVKDNFCTRGVPTTCASAMLRDFIPPYTATVVERLQNAGAYTIGKTNLDEFAMGSGTVDSIFGPTFNVYGSGLDNTGKEDFHVAGGSSGGSAVAVASGVAFAGLGSDTGGSTRNPASYCGIVGYKPTYGSLSRHGLIPLVNSMDVPGILTRNVRDAAVVYNAIRGRDKKDSTTVDDGRPVKLPCNISVKGIKIGIPVEYHCTGMSGVVVEAWNTIAVMLKSAGAIVKQISLKHTEMSLPVYSVLNQCEVASNMARYDGIRYGYRSSEEELSTNQMFSKNRSASLNQAVRARILAGNYFLLARNYAGMYTKAMQVRRIISEEFASAWSEVDLLLTPTTLTAAPRIEEWIRLNNREQCSINDFCTQPANMTGCPAISIPVGLSSSGMPLSVQLMAANFRDKMLLAVADFVFRESGFTPYISTVTPVVSESEGARGG